MTDRGVGRNRSEIPDLAVRIEALDQTLSEELSDFAYLFNVEAFAWAILQRLQAELFERRLGAPTSDAEVFTLLQAHHLITQPEARQLRQFCEARNLSSRDL